MRGIVNKLGLSFILLDNFFKIDYGFDFRAQYVLYLLFIVFFFWTNKNIRIDIKVVTYATFFITVLGIISLIKGFGFTGYLKQTALIVYNVVFSYTLLNSYRFDLLQIFKDYIQLIYLAAVVGCIQFISLLIGFKFGADFSYLGIDMGNFDMDYARIQSWFEEPSFMAYAFIPVVFICVCRFFNLTDLISAPKALFITVIFILSQSAIGAIGLVISLLIVIGSKYSLFRKPHLAIIFTIMLSLVSIGTYHIPAIKIRTDDTLAIFLSDDVSSSDISKINLSTYALYSNFKVTKASLSENLVFGTGLGTYGVVYSRHIDDVVPESALSKYQFNKKDANSLLLRVAAEMGLLGVLALIIFLFKNRVRIIPGEDKIATVYWIMSHSILVLIILRLLRQGHYTILGFALFVMIYFYTKKELDKYLAMPELI